MAATRSKPEVWELGRKVQVFNGTLRKLRMERGWKQSDLAERVGLKSATISHYETLHTVPDIKIATKIAAVFGKKPEEVFPREFLKMMSANKENLVSTDYAKMELKALENYAEKQTKLLEDRSDPEKEFMKQEKRRILYEILSSSYLSEREKDIVSMLWGLAEYDRAHTLDEVATKYDVARERIRQINIKAMSKMRRYTLKPEFNKKYKEVFEQW